MHLCVDFHVGPSKEYLIFFLFLIGVWLFLTGCGQGGVVILNRGVVILNRGMVILNRGVVILNRSVVILNRGVIFLNWLWLLSRGCGYS